MSKQNKSKQSKQVRVKRALKGPNTEFRQGSAYRQLFDLGASKQWDRAELIAKAAKVIGKEERLVAIDLNVLLNPGHTSNGFRSANMDNAKAAGKIQLFNPQGVKPTATKVTKPSGKAKATKAAKTTKTTKPAKKAVKKVKKTVVEKKPEVTTPATPAPAPAATAPVEPAPATPTQTTESAG